MANRFFTLFLIAVMAFSCSTKQNLIQNPERLADIQRMLTVQKELTSKSQMPIWDVFNQQLTADEKQALEFVYA